jgi:threonine/homoserine/homoserine lactone efflux protein
VGTFLSFVAAALVIIITPGQDTALTIRNTLAAGRRGGVLTAVGVSLGQATWTLAVSAGLAALLMTSRQAFSTLELLGSAYLVLLGGRAAFRALRSRTSTPPAAAPAANVLLPPATALRQGLLSNLSNPKMLVFFASLLPQFATSFGGLIIRGVTFCSLTLGWLSACAYAVAGASGLVRRPRAWRLVEALTGAVLVALGVRLAVAAIAAHQLGAPRRAGSAHLMLLAGAAVMVAR